MPIAKVNGININYKIEGQGEPLVLIMGLGGPMSMWKWQVSFFKQYYQVITFDNRGIGLSDKPQGPYSTEMMAEDTIRLMEYLNIKRANILGVSLGGAIGQAIAIHYPERVIKLVLGSTYSGNDGVNGSTAEMLETAKLPVRQALIRLLSLSLNKSLRRTIYILYLQIQARFLKEPDITGLRAQAEAALKHDAIDKLPLIQAPTLVIVGTKDRVIRPNSSETLVKLIPGAKLVKFENGSHLVCTEMYGAFNETVLNFLQGA